MNDSEPREVLINEGEPGGNDYRLVGNSCWLAVGDFVLYIRLYDDNSVTVEAYPEPSNTFEQPIADFSLYQRTP